MDVEQTLPEALPEDWISEQPCLAGTLLELKFWRVARTPEQIPIKKKLMVRDVEMWLERMKAKQ